MAGIIPEIAPAMTVPSEQSRITYDTDGSSVSFPVPFRFLQNRDLRVTLIATDESSTTLALDVDYSVTGAGQQSGGTLSTTDILAAGATLLIERIVAITQETEYQRNDPFPERAHEKALDKLTMIAQQVAEPLGMAPGGRTRVLMQRDADQGQIGRLPLTQTRAGKMMGFDANGDPRVSTMNVEELEAAPGIAQDAAQTAVSAAGTATTAAESASQDSASAHTDAATASDAKDVAVVAADDAIAAAAASGSVKFAKTVAEAESNVDSYPDGQIVEVAVDEYNDGHRTRYVKDSGVLIFYVDLDRPVSQVRADLATQGSLIVAKTTVSLESIADLISQQESDRRTDKLYVVKSYYPGASLGGGNFVWDPASMAEPDAGAVFAANASATGRFIRQTDGLTATPYWYGIPYQSDNDWTERLQALITFPRFWFPAGFKARAKNLISQSNVDFGNYADAHITLPDGAHGQCAVIYMLAGCKNSRFYGGVFDGNRDNVTATNAAPVVLGVPNTGDGGMHSLLIGGADNVVWDGSPRFINAETDCLYVRETGGTINAQINDPRCLNGSRQGLTVFSCSHLGIHDGEFAYTNGKAPEAGIDMEPYVGSGPLVANIVFTGTQRIHDNQGRGILMGSNGSTSTAGNQLLEVIADEVHLINNSIGTDDSGFRMTGYGRLLFRAQRLLTDGTVSIGGGEYSEFDVPSVICRSFQARQFSSAALELRIRIRELVDGYGGFVSNVAVTTPFLLDAACAIRDIEISSVRSSNAGNSSNNSYSGYVIGGPDLRLVIADYASRSPRGLRLAGTPRIGRIGVTVDQAMQNDAVWIQPAATGWDVSARKTVADTHPAITVNAQNSRVSCEWEGANANPIVLAAGANANYISSVMRGGTASGVYANASAGTNFIAGCMLSRTDAGDLLGGPGLSNQVRTGNFPLSVNT